MSDKKYFYLNILGLLVACVLLTSVARPSKLTKDSDIQININPDGVAHLNWASFGEFNEIYDVSVRDISTAQTVGHVNTFSNSANISGLSSGRVYVFQVAKSTDYIIVDMQAP